MRVSIGRHGFRFFIPLLLLGVLCACHGGRAQVSAGELARTSPANVSSDTIVLPEGSRPTGVFTTSSLSLLVKTGETTPTDRFHRSLYSWQPGKQPNFIIGGHFLDVLRLSDDEFASTWYSLNNENSPVEFAALDAHGLISQPLMLPPGGPTGWAGCEGDTHYVVCTGNVPTMTAGDKDYDEMGFSAVVVIDLEQRKTSWFPVKHQTYFHFNPARKLIYVADVINPKMNSPVKSFDLVGHEQGDVQVWDVSLSPSGQFAESLQEDGAESWEIYDVAHKNLLLAFNCGKPECKLGDREESHHWNPVVDGQVVALNSGGAYGRGGTCDVYQSSPPRLVKPLPCDGLPVFDWSRNGRELITLATENGQFRRALVN